MIEVKWKFEPDTPSVKILQFMTEFFTWFFNMVRKYNEEHEDLIDIAGVILVSRTGVTPASLIMLYENEKIDKTHRVLLDILFQPEEQFKDKYIACVPAEEPNPVQEQKDQTSIISSDVDMNSEKTETKNEDETKT